MISTKKYFKAGTVENAIEMAMENHSSFKYLAGGTDLIVNKFQGNEQADVLIDLSTLTRLKEIKKSSTQLSIGALVNLDELMNHQDILYHFPVLSEAIRSVASPTIRKTATIGGNLLCENRCSFYNQSEWWRKSAGYCLKCNGHTCLASGGSKFCYSKFVSDTAVVLISLKAEIEIEDEKGVKIIPLESIYTGDGIHPRSLMPAAIVKSINLPLGQAFKSVYKKLRKRESLDFTSLTTAVTVDISGGIRIVLGGIHAKPILIEGSTSDDLNLLVSQAVANSRIVDNDTYSRKYRKDMITVLLNRSFKEINITS